MVGTSRRWVAAVLAGVAACSAPPPKPPPITAENHPFFPIAPGTAHEFGKTGMTIDGPMTCEGCHPPAAVDFADFTCVSCHLHDRAITDRLHLGEKLYSYASRRPTDGGVLLGCITCHSAGAKVPYDHFGVSDQCAACHDVDTAFPALPKPGFTHAPIGAADCGGCHETSAWSNTRGAPSNTFDPTASVTVNALRPTWAGTSIISVTADRQVIPMTMNHLATGVDAGVVAVCSNCHAQADQGQFYPGVMHWALANLAVPQPTTCQECHATAAPSGFVGALDSRRSPSSGEMKHDAVGWINGAPTSTKLLTAGCSLCHQAPTEYTAASWTIGAGTNDGGLARFHGALTAASLPQPGACLDCHANTRPVTPVATAGRTFDHSAALGECQSCHTSTTQWLGGKYHLVGGPTPATCLPCHDGDRPSSTSTWLGPYAASPFDYVTNANGVTHGAGQDCATCHSGPGTGSWGTNPNWRGGRFHVATSSAATTCISCHTTQRPDLLTPSVDAGYDHAASGAGDCYGCHQATVTRGVYTNLRPIPGGDWRGGQSYPGATLISASPNSVRVQSTTLARTGALVTGMSTTSVNLPNAFLHTSTAIPAPVFPGSATAPNQSTCWHCHTSTGTTVTAYSNGRFHSALTTYRSMPAAAISPLPQPATCNDCHRTMRPPNIVSKTDAGTWLLPMDHAAAFTGGSVPNVPGMDCSACHGTPGLGPTQWSDGTFHPKLPTGASPSECVGCHFPLITTAQADVTIPDAGLPSRFVMKHRSTLITTQACATCHPGALAASTTAPMTARSWRPGVYHSALSPTTQPVACLDCHANSDPSGATQGTAVYLLAQGGTASNGAQWMNHAHATVSGRDCASCHLADAQVSGSAWSRGPAYHSKVPSVTGCATCHGITNGRGTVVGTNNNLPAGLTDSVTLTTSSAAPANTRDQLTHTDSNVTRLDCNACHTQVGRSTAAGVMGKEWSKAVFHRSFTSANPLVLNGTTGRCSNCHLNVKPGTSYTQHAHAAYTATSAQDCSSCHSWPGTSTVTPNWLGVTNSHAASGPTATSTLDCNTCHGQSGSATRRLGVPAASHYGGIANGNKCTSCHVSYAGFRDTVTNLKYGHTNAAANAGGCVTCHAFAAQLYTTLTNTPPLTRPTAAGGHQFSQTASVTGTFSGRSFTSTHSSAGLTRCGACHQYAATTATTNVWIFKHRPNNPGISNSTSTSGCSLCH